MQRCARKPKAKNIPDAELLYDTYLYEKPEEALLKERYADVISVVENAPGEENGLSGWRGFLARNFGVILLRREEDREYRAASGRDRESL